MSSFKDQFVRVGNINTRYWQAGASGSAVILLHGIGCSVLEWQSNLAALAAHHRVFAIDLLGFGLSDKPQDETYGMRRLAQFTLDFLATQGVARAHFAGNSMGGRIALECALIAPERVASMLLAAPAGIGRETLINFKLASVRGLGELLTRPNRFGLKMLWKLAFRDRSFVTKEFVEARYQLACLPGAQAAFLKTLRSFLAFGGFPREQVAALQAALPAIRTPALVIWGRQDKLLPVAHADILKRLLPEVQVQVFDPCGHLPQIECAARFNEQALRFWAGLDGA